MGNYITYRYFKGHKDLSDNQVRILKEAFKQINSNMHIIDNYFDLPGHRAGRDGKCLTKRLTGKNMLRIRAKAGMKNAFARVVPVATLNTNRVTFYSSYLSACSNSWNEAEATSNGGTSCAVAELAGTLIHEATHTCLGNEKYGYLASYYYRFSFRRENRYTAVTCSANSDPSSWLPQDYQNKSAVQAETPYCGIYAEPVDIPGLPDIPGIASPVKYILSC